MAESEHASLPLETLPHILIPMTSFLASALPSRLAGVAAHGLWHFLALSSTQDAVFSHLFLVCSVVWSGGSP